MKKTISVLLTVVSLAFTMMCIPANAALPYTGFTYDEWENAIPSQIGYKPQKTIAGDAEGKISFTGAKDLYIDTNGDLYIANSGKNEIVILDSQSRLKKALSVFQTEEGEETLNDPSGVYQREGRLYIADTGNQRVIISDLEGKIEQILTKPTTEIFPQDSDFLPNKVLADQSGNLYVICSGIYQGAAFYTKNYEFKGYFGSNKVEPTAQLLADLFWSKFLTNQQKEFVTRYVPIEYTDFAIDAQNIIYTCTAQNQTGQGQLRKLNSADQNLFDSTYNYGEKQQLFYKGQLFDTSFVGITVNENGFVFGLDKTRGRIYQYDNAGEPVFIFGGLGGQVGTFAVPTAIAAYQNAVYVLDSQKNNITVFVPTEYGQAVNEAIVMYNNGEYMQSEAMWRDILKQNANNYLAYVGIGKSLLQMGQNKKAMDYIKMGRDRELESEAFEVYRQEISQFVVGAVIITILVLIALWLIYKLIKRCKKKKGGLS